MMNKENLFDWEKALLETNDISNLVESLEKMPIVEIAEILNTLPNEGLAVVLPLLDKNLQGPSFSKMDIRKQLSFFQSISKKRFAPIFENMPSEDRADFFQHLTQDEQASLFPYISNSTRENVLSLSAYPPETAGGIMSTDFATVTSDMTCEQAIAKIRVDSPSRKMIYYIYVLGSDNALNGFVSIKDLIMAEPSQRVSTVYHKDFIFAQVDEDRETVAAKVDKYDLIAIPVINKKGQLVGIITHDEVLDIVRAEQTEDIEKFMGIMPQEDELNYLDTSSLQHFRKRVVWLVSLAILGLISGLIIHSFETTMEKLLILALYMPMVADTGGNAGSQSATVVIRALALGQITLKKWFKVVLKEAKISFLLAICLGVVAFGKVLFLSWNTDLPAAYTLGSIAFVIALALSLQVITSTILGASLPLLVKKAGGDPAVVASPAITTIVDITGLIIYFSTATLFFSL